MDNIVHADAERILREMIAKYEDLAGSTLSPADVERLIIDVMAYRELLLRMQVNRVEQQNYVQTATAQYLDRWGELFGFARAADQTDDEYRQVLLAGISRVAVGTREAHYARIVGMDEVLDLMIETKQIDSTLPPGVTRLYPLIKDDRGGLIWGMKHTLGSSVEDDIRYRINDEKFGIIGEQFIFDELDELLVDGAIEANAATGEDLNAKKAEIDEVVDEYLAELSRSLGGVFDVDELQRRIYPSISGLLELPTMNFVNIPNAGVKQYLTRGTIDIVVK